VKVVNSNLILMYVGDGDFIVIIFISLCSCDELDVICGWTFEWVFFFFLDS